MLHVCVITHSLRTTRIIHEWVISHSSRTTHATLMNIATCYSILHERPRHAILFFTNDSCHTHEYCDMHVACDRLQYHFSMNEACHTHEPRVWVMSHSSRTTHYIIKWVFSHTFTDWVISHTSRTTHFINKWVMSHLWTQVINSNNNSQWMSHVTLFTNNSRH